jgi:hypothetical protein
MGKQTMDFIFKKQENKIVAHSKDFIKRGILKDTQPRGSWIK